MSDLSSDVVLFVDEIHYKQLIALVNKSEQLSKQFEELRACEAVDDPDIVFDHIQDCYRYFQAHINEQDLVMSELAECFPPRIYRTSAHRVMIQHIMNDCRQLYHGAGKPESAASLPISSIVDQAIERCGVAKVVNQFERNLQVSDRRVFLFIDELDLLYQLHDDSIHKDHAINSLWELQRIANIANGRVVAILAGSSASIPTLIKKNEIEHLKEEFPLVKWAPNLNGSKYSVWRTDTELYDPFNLSVTASIVGLPPFDYCTKEQRAFLRLVSFVGGNTPRIVEKVMACRTDEQLEQVGADRDSGSSTMKHELYRFLYEKIIFALIEKNSDLLNALAPLPSKIVNSDIVENYAWEDEFKQLKLDDIEPIFRAAKDRFPKMDQQTCLEWLSDRNYIVLGRYMSGCYHEIWPRDMAQLTRLRWVSKITAVVSSAKQIVAGDKSVDHGLMEIGQVSGASHILSGLGAQIFKYVEQIVVK